MNAVLRLITEYGALGRVLDRQDMASVLAASIAHAPAILRRGKLTALDAAMSRNLAIHFKGARVALPLADVDRLLAHRKDNPTFGNLREMYARNCYLRRLKLKKPVRAVLDLGANRGMFSLLALTVLDSEIVVGVEPTMDYDAVLRLFLQANGCAPRTRAALSQIRLQPNH